MLQLARVLCALTVESFWVAQRFTAAIEPAPTPTALVAEGGHPTLSPVLELQTKLTSEAKALSTAAPNRCAKHCSTLSLIIQATCGIIQHQTLLGGVDLSATTRFEEGLTQHPRRL